jgi:flagellar hook-length control protein FliK
MPAIEIITVVKDLNPAGANASMLGKMSTSSSKSGSPNNFLGMMQTTIAEYQSQNQSRTEINSASGSDDNQMGKIFLIKNHHPAQDNGKTQKSEGNASPGEITTKPADENSTDEKQETIATPPFIAAFIEKIITPSTAMGADETGTASVPAIQKGGEKGLVSLKDVLVLLNSIADDLDKQHKDILASPAKKNNFLTEANLNTIPEMKNQLVMALEDKGFSAEEIKYILKAVEERSVKSGSADQLLQTINQPEIKNELVKVLEAKGITVDVVAGIIKEIDQAMMDKVPVGQHNIKEPDQIIMAKSPVAQQNMEEPDQVIMDKEPVAQQNMKEPDQVIMDKEPVEQLNMRESDQVIMAKLPEVKQDDRGKSPAYVEPTSTSFRQAAVAILEKNGFSADEIKGILKAVDQATVGVGVMKPDVSTHSDQSIFIQQSLYHEEVIKEATVGRKKMHADIYQKEASLEDFRHENVEGQLKINPPEEQLVKELPQKELLEQPVNTRQSEKKNVFSDVLLSSQHKIDASLKKTENKQPIVNDKEINGQQLGKVITATDQNDQGKWLKLAGDATAKTSNTLHEEIILPAGREQSPMHSDISSMAAKGADFHFGKTNVDTSKSIYQSVVDQIQDSFSLAQNKDAGQIRLTLKPEIMGHLDMQIAVRNETVQIVMTVENEKVHQAMNAHIDDLKTALQNQGLKIDKIEVTLQNQPDPGKTFYQDQSNSRFNNPGQNSHHERMLNRELYLGEDNYPKSIQEIIQKQNSMEGVSIFA